MSTPTRDDTPRVAGIVLAAGRGERFGRDTKQLADLDGRPLVDHVLDAATTAGLTPVVVVVGHDGDAVGDAVRGRAVVVDNPDHARGQATSLSAGVDALAALGDHGNDPRPIAATVVLLADEPTVTAGAVRGVLAAHAAGAVVVRCRYDDRPGHPVLLDRSVWSAARAADGDRGARHLFERDDLVEVPVVGPAPRDVDTPDELAALRARGG